MGTDVQSAQGRGLLTTMEDIMIELRMSEPQGLALLAMVRRGAPPDELDGRNLSAMHRAADRIEAALNRR